MSTEWENVCTSRNVWSIGSYLICRLFYWSQKHKYYPAQFGRRYHLQCNDEVTNHWKSFSRIIKNRQNLSIRSDWFLEKSELAGFVRTLPHLTFSMNLNYVASVVMRSACYHPNFGLMKQYYSSFFKCDWHSLNLLSNLQMIFHIIGR